MLVRLLMVVLMTLNFNTSEIELQNIESVNITNYGIMINYEDNTGYYIDFEEVN